VTAVSDEEILDAKAVVDASGVGCEPASAASVAGVRQMVARGVIGASEHVVAVLTGHLLKDPEAVTEYHIAPHPGSGAGAGAHPRNAPVEIAGRLDEVAKFIR